MAKFIDVDNYDTPSKNRNLINTQHIIRIERLKPGDENSPINIHLVDGTVVYSNISYAKYVQVLDGIRP